MSQTTRSTVEYELLVGHLTRSVLLLGDVPHAYGNAPPHRAVRYYPEAVFNQGVNHEEAAT